MKLLRSALAAVGSTPAERPGRERLKAALSHRDAAHQAVIDARVELAHLQSFVLASADLAKSAADDARAANDFRGDWVRSGCRYSDTLTLQTLEDKATESSNAAKRAAVNADAVRKELSRAQGAVTSAEGDLRECEGRIANEADLICVGEFDLERGARLAAELHSWLIERRALRDAVTGEEAGRLLQSAGHRARIPEIPDYAVTQNGTLVDRPPDEVLARTKTWRERAAQLLENPDA